LLENGSLPGGVNLFKKEGDVCFAKKHECKGDIGNKSIEKQFRCVFVLEHGGEGSISGARRFLIVEVFFLFWATPFFELSWPFWFKFPFFESCCPFCKPINHFSLGYLFLIN
jgi:hypothetical protein